MATGWYSQPIDSDIVYLQNIVDSETDVSKLVYPFQCWFQYQLMILYVKCIASKYWDTKNKLNILGPVVQSVISLTSSLRVISLTVLADSIHNILIFFAEKMTHICSAKNFSIFAYHSM